MISIILDHGTPGQRVFATVPETLGDDRVNARLAKARELKRPDQSVYEITLIGPWDGTKDQKIGTDVPVRKLTENEEYVSG